MNIWSCLFVPASPLVVAEPKKSRDKKNHNWNATPERLFLKCILGHLVRSGLARKDLLVKFKRLIPDYDMFFDSPVSDSAIWGRADTGRRQGKYANENPDVHPLSRPYWELARMIVEDGEPLTATDIRSMAKLVLPAAAE